MKKTLSVILTISMLLCVLAAFPGVSFASTPEGTAVTSVDDFIAMDPNGTYYLANDIDFADVNYDGGSIYTQGFYGTLDGNGHSLLNIKIESGSDTGIFSSGFGGTLKNLTVGAEGDPANVTCTGGGKAAAVVAVTCSEDATFENVTVYANLYCGSDSKTAAFAGWVASGKTLNFTNCTVNGSITGGPAAGYVVTNRSDAINLNFTNCVNNANVSTGDSAGRPTAGFFTIHWSGTTDNIFNITVKNCVNNGTITAYKDGNGGTAAGFICPDREMKVNCTIENSINNGIIDGGKGSAGGLFSVRVDSNNVGHPITVTVKNSVNTGSVTAADWRAGGIIGIFGMNSASTLTVDHCYNTGAVTNNGGGGNACGIVGEMAQMGCDSGATRTITNCYNIGALTTNTSEICRVGGGDQASQIISNCFYTVEGARAIEGGCTTDNVTYVADAAALLAALSACEPEGAEVTFVADSENINGGYPVLSWQVASEEEPEDTDDTTATPEEPEVPEAPSFSGGTITETATGEYTIASDDFSAFVSRRRVDDNNSDLRFVLAANLEGLGEYSALYMNIVFSSGDTVVASMKKNVATELLVYASATAAGNTYTAAEGSVLFGVVITNIPNNAWTNATVALTDENDETVVSGGTTAGDVVPQPVAIDEIEGINAHLWGTPFETPSNLGGKVALIYRVAGADVFTTVNDMINAGKAYAVVTIDGTEYTIENYENNGDIFRMDVESPGAVIYSGLSYTVKVEFYSAEGDLLYYSKDYTAISTITSSNAQERTPMNVELPEGLTKLTVSGYSTENISHWGDGPVASLFDGDTTGTKMGGNTSGSPTVYFSLSEASTITYYTFTTGGDTGTYTDRNPYGWTFYGKVGEEWVVLSEISDNKTQVTGFTPANSTPYSYQVTNPQACTEYKIVLRTGGGFQLNELEVYAG